MPDGRHEVLVYDYVEDILERRAPHREAHLAHIDEWVASGAMLMAGAVGDPPSGGMFLFGPVGAAEIERFAAGDPYVAAGLVRARRVLSWNVVRSSV